MSVYIKQLGIGPMQNFCYLIGDLETKDCAVVDPAWEIAKILRTAETDGYKITKALLTHNHPDHTTGLEDLVKNTGAKVMIHKLDASAIGGQVVGLSDGTEIKIGSVVAKVIHTPGHTPGSVCFLVEGKHLFTGDTLFQGNCGRFDLPGSNGEALFKSLKHLARLDPETIVYPGHDYGVTPTSTIGFERENNAAMTSLNYEDFVSE